MLPKHCSMPGSQYNYMFFLVCKVFGEGRRTCSKSEKNKLAKLRDVIAIDVLGENIFFYIYVLPYLCCTKKSLYHSSLIRLETVQSKNLILILKLIVEVMYLLLEMLKRQNEGPSFGLGNIEVRTI